MSGRTSSSRPLFEPADLVNPDLELGLLGSLIYNPGNLENLPPGFTSAAFAHDELADIFDAIQVVAERGETNMMAGLRSAVPALATGGPGTLLHQIVDANLSSANPDMFAGTARAVKYLADRRALIAIADRLRLQAGMGDVVAPTQGLITQVMMELDVIQSATQKVRTGATLGEAMDEVLTQAEEVASGLSQPGLTTGLRDLDEKLGGGLLPGWLVVLAARPAMGKSALGFAMAREAAQNGERAVIFSLEMGRREVAARLLSEQVGVTARAILNGDMSPAQRVKMSEAHRLMSQLPLHIEDQPGRTVAEIRLRCRALARTGPLGLIVVDHLGKVKAPPEVARRGLREATAYNSGALKELAQEFNCPVVLLAQLNRSVDGRDDKRPTMADLREAGQIEEDADVIALLYREEYYLKDRAPKRKAEDTTERWLKKQAEHEAMLQAHAGRGDILIAKLRGGEPGPIRAMFDGPTTSWRDVPASEAVDPWDHWGEYGQ